MTTRKGTMNWDLKIRHMLPSSMIVVGLRILRLLVAPPVSMFLMMMIDVYSLSSSQSCTVKMNIFVLTIISYLIYAKLLMYYLQMWFHNDFAFFMTHCCVIGLLWVICVVYLCIYRLIKE